MNITGIGEVQKFWLKHRNAEVSLRTWLTIVVGARWKTFVDCRSTYSAADQVRVSSGVVTVFNIKGNKYRLVAAVFYPQELVVVRCVMTHTEYSEDRWKDQL